MRDNGNVIMKPYPIFSFMLKLPRDFLKLVLWAGSLYHIGFVRQNEHQI